MGQFDLSGFLGESAAENALNDAQRVKIFYVSLDELECNKLNPFDYDSIEELAECILDFGLITVMNVHQEGDKYIVDHGNRRLHALRYLTEHDKHYTFHGKDITGMAPVSVTEKEKDEAKEIITLIAANAHRDLTNDQKNRLIKITFDAYEDGTLTWPEGERKAHAVAAVTGIREHYVKDYLAEMKKEKNRSAAGADGSGSDSDSSEKEKKAKEVSEEEKLYKKLLKEMNKLGDSFKDVDANQIDGLPDSQIQMLELSASYLMKQLDKILKMKRNANHKDYAKDFLIISANDRDSKQIRYFAENGDKEAIMESLKYLGQTKHSRTFGELTYDVTPSTITFNYDGGIEETLSLRTFSDMLIKRASYL